MAAAGQLPLTVIRPSWLFGERDRTTIPRLIQEFRWHRVSIVGKGDNPLSAVYAGVVADAAHPGRRTIPDSVGEAYNITSHCRITQREFLDMLADALGVPRVTWHYPFWYAFYGGFSLEMRDRLLLSRKPPRVTRYGAWLLGRYLEYSTEKARTKLGWAPALTIARASSGRSAGSWTTSRRGCPTTRCRRWYGSARGSGGSERTGAGPGSGPAGRVSPACREEPGGGPGAAGVTEPAWLDDRQDAAEADVGQPLRRRPSPRDTRALRSSRPP